MEAECVLLYRLAMRTRGHNTNNYSEASIRILKDIVLDRTKALDVMALVEFLSVVWKRYCYLRLGDHANLRVARHRLLHESLLAKIDRHGKRQNKT